MLRFIASPLARSVADLLDNDPSGWTADHYHAEHRSGLRIWVANKAYGLTVTTPRRMFKFWDVTMWCLVGGSPNQWLVWLAFARWRRGLLADELAAAHAGAPQ
jgi:hypothetical protein